MAQTPVDNTTRFSGKHEAYTKYRPSYPPEALELVAQELSLQNGDTILDMGSGTGILSDLMLTKLHPTHKLKVIGLEPNADMRGVQEASLKDWISQGVFESLNGTAEASTLPDRSVDMAVVASAFHWFDGPKTRAEILRVVKPRDGKGASMAIFTSAAFADVDVPENLKRAKSITEEFRQLRAGSTIRDAISRNREKLSDEALRAFWGSRDRYTVRHYPSARTLTWDQAQGLLASFSSTPQEGTTEYQNLLRDLKDMFDKRQIDGKIEFFRNVAVYYGHVG